MESQSPTVHQISQCFIKPKHITEESKQPLHFSPWDLAMLSVNYIQKGLLFKKPNSPNYSINPLLHKLKESLSLTLVHYYPLAGRLATVKQEDPHLYKVFVDCVNSPGAKFIHAAVDLTVGDVLSPVDVPVVVQAFFDHDKAINHDGHNESLLTVQVTELIDGIFVGVSINHMVVDGTSYWNFFNALSQVFKAKEEGLGDNVPFSSLPVHKHWFPNGHNAPFINLPFTHQDQFISRHQAPQLSEIIFHFSSNSLSKLKSKANSLSNTTKISTLQALSAFMWICITRVRKLPLSQKSNCRMAINNRSRLDPPLSQDYFGNCIQTVSGSATAGDLLEHGLGWAAWLLHEAVAGHTDKNVREWVDAWMKKPFIYQLGQFFDPKSVMMGSSPRFDMYGCEFGLGRGLAVLSGYAHKFDGKVTLYPAAGGGGAMDLEVCLLPEWMSDLESDEEFMSFASLPRQN